jgi:hypothetical protein
MRLFVSLLTTAAMVFAATTASALTFSATATTGDGSPLNAITQGTSVTIQINVVADPGDSINGLGADVYGYDGALSFVSGVATDVIMADVRLPPAPVLCNYGVIARCDYSWTGGLGNTQIDTANLAESPANDGSQNRVTIFKGIDLDYLWGDSSIGVEQPGADGTTGTTQFTVVFTASAAGSRDVIVGTGVDLGGVVTPGNIQANNASIQLTVVPEPGTALLMGLGLAGLAAAGRRRE